jgi:hypothetical protein
MLLPMDAIVCAKKTEFTKLGYRTGNGHDEHMPVSIRKYDNERLPKDITYMRINGKFTPDWDAYYLAHGLLG